MCYFALRMMFLPYSPAGIMKFRLCGFDKSDIFFSNCLFIWSSLYHVAEKKGS